MCFQYIWVDHTGILQYIADVMDTGALGLHTCCAPNIRRGHGTGYILFAKYTLVPWDCTSIVPSTFIGVAWATTYGCLIHIRAALVGTFSPMKIYSDRVGAKMLASRCVLKLEVRCTLWEKSRSDQCRRPCSWRKALKEAAELCLHSCGQLLHMSDMLIYKPENMMAGKSTPYSCLPTPI